MEKVNRTTRNGAAFTISNLDLAAGRGGASEEIIGLLGLYPRWATASITRYYLGHVELGAIPVAGHPILTRLTLLVLSEGR